MTTYDAYGRPMQAVDPNVATAGIVTAGAVGFILGASTDNCHSHYRNDRSYYFRPRSHGHYSCY